MHIAIRAATDQRLVQRLQSRLQPRAVRPVPRQQRRGVERPVQADDAHHREFERRGRPLAQQVALVSLEFGRRVGHRVDLAVALREEVLRRLRAECVEVRLELALLRDELRDALLRVVVEVSHAIALGPDLLLHALGPRLHGVARSDGDAALSLVLCAQQQAKRHALSERVQGAAGCSGALAPRVPLKAFVRSASAV